MATINARVDLARKLHPRLQRFFAANPPDHLLKTQGDQTLISSRAEIPKTPFQRLNPFQPNKNPGTGRWHPPIYSLRQQAELVKLAKEQGVEDLLPFTVKKTEERERRRVEHGLRVKGTGVGQSVKGHLWERTLKGRLDKRRQAMLEMPALIRQWKERGHGRGWKKWPK